MQSLRRTFRNFALHLSLCAIVTVALAKSPRDELLGLWLEDGKDRIALEIRSDGIIRNNVSPSNLSDGGSPNNKRTWQITSDGKLKITPYLMGKEFPFETVAYKIQGESQLTIVASDGSSRAYHRIAPDAFLKLPPPGPIGWAYTDDVDKLRGTSNKFATAISAPDGYGSKVKLVLRKRDQDGFVIMFTAGDAHFFDCTMICKIPMKFDNSPLQGFDFTPSDGMPTAIFVHREQKAKLLNYIRTSKHLLVELPYISFGARQYDFSTNDLKWE